MARFGNSADPSLRLETTTGALGQLQYVAFPVRRTRVSPTEHIETSKRHVLLERSLEDGMITIAPLNTLAGSERFFQSKYPKLLRITFAHSEAGAVDNPFEEEGEPVLFGPDTFDVDEFLESLPPGFVKDPQYGLGLLKDNNRLVRLIEDHSECSELRIVPGSGIKVDDDVFRMGQAAWEELWSEIVRINNRGNIAASRVKDSFVNNYLADALGLEQSRPKLGRLTMSKLLTRAANGEEALTEDDQVELLSAMQAQARVATEVAPDTVVALQHDLELVNLDRLIERFEADLEKKHGEEHWQQFFASNAFALQQVFGSPVVSVVSKASVGGTKLDGSGNKIADYLVKNPLTANVALVEIKTPTTKIVKSTAYRDGVYGITSELSQAVTQVLDQAHQLKLHFANVKSDSRQYDLEAYSIGCFVIAGRLPPADQPDKTKSLELFRGNSRAVSIVTFDEVLASLRLLRDLLTDEPSATDPGAEPT
ncbi:Shedu immune nuclease family protein [Microbacterium sp. UBA3394]|uniref:Shedu immune nuclease family protein n=1 Tax=Microbacterium sp. UBA3394 TaxID=1946945 RepID=UPI00257AE7E5|nr:Shedu immune nuclease family protein [Microbacterium sp. UBA3394]|tara:strand:+ start:1685 stop:3127 length:1443 start_codon:yes stop_codon:yes gene_type:complete